MLSRISLYDFVAAVIPGMVFLWGVGSLAARFAFANPLPIQGQLTETSILLALSYVTGLLLQAVSELLTQPVLLKIWKGFPSARWLLVDDGFFNQQTKENLRAAIKAKFNFSLPLDAPTDATRANLMKANQQAFYLCLNLVEQEKATDRPLIFNAHYALFRCLLTMFTLLFLVAVACIFVFWRSHPGQHSFISILCFVSVIGVVLCYFRAKKRGEDFAKSVFDAFLAKHTTPASPALIHE